MSYKHFPHHWDIKKLSDIGHSYAGLRSKTKNDFHDSGSAKFVTYRNINQNYFIDKDELGYVDVASEENQNKVIKGDILFTGSSETPDEVGISSVMMKEEDDIFLNSFCFGYRFNSDEFVPRFYGYYFRSNQFRNAVLPLAQGSTRYNLSKNELLKIKVPIPLYKEQNKIAAILTSVDEAIEKTEAIIEQTETVKKGLMQELLTKGIGHTDFKNTPLGEVPKDWEVLKLIDIVGNKKNSIKPGPFGSSLKKEFYVESGYKVYGQEQVIPNDFSVGNYYINEKKFEELKGFEIKPGDLLISLVGTFGKIAIVPEDYEPGIINPRLLKISFDKTKSAVNFYKYYMSSSPFYNQLSGLSQGGTMGVINSKTLKSLFFPCPPIEEQYNIIKILHSFDVRLQNEKQYLERLHLLKKGLMQDLLTGKVRVQVDDPEVIHS